MTRKRPIYAQPIGFLSGRGPASPVQVPTSAPYPPFAGPHYLPNHTPFTHQGSIFPQGGPPGLPPGSGGPLGIPPAAQPTNPGIGGILQNLLNGKNSIDIPAIMTNAQKVIGVVNQLGTAVRNMSPMLEMLKGLSEADPLDDIEQGSSTSKRKRVRRRGNARRKGGRAKSQRRVRKRRSTS